MLNPFQPRKPTKTSSRKRTPETTARAGVNEEGTRHLFFKKDFPLLFYIGYLGGSKKIDVFPILSESLGKSGYRNDVVRFMWF